MGKFLLLLFLFLKIEEHLLILSTVKNKFKHTTSWSSKNTYMTVGNKNFSKYTSVGVFKSYVKSLFLTCSSKIPYYNYLHLFCKNLQLPMAPKITYNY